MPPVVAIRRDNLLMASTLLYVVLIDAIHKLEEVQKSPLHMMKDRTKIVITLLEFKASVERYKEYDLKA